MRATGVIGATLVALAAAAPASAAPMIVLYDEPATVRAMVRGAGLPVDGRVFIQEPNVGHLHMGERDRPYRLARVTDDELLAARTGPGMAALLRRRIDRADCIPGARAMSCPGRLVFVDEIDHRFAERAPNLDTPAWRGRTSRNQPARRFPNYVPTPRPGQPGYELGRAMRQLAATPYPGGGTYAERVHFYVSPGVVTSIGLGRGRYHNLGRDRRPHFRSHEGVRPALQLAGGVWLEMYHFRRATRTRSPFNTYEWQVYPWRFRLWLTGPGTTRPDPALTAKLHFLMTRGTPLAKGGAPAVCRRATRQTCQFTLATSPRNRPILANGVGAYRMERDAAGWTRHVRRLLLG
jgi:hypothetical protein